MVIGPRRMVRRAHLGAREVLRLGPRGEEHWGAIQVGVAVTVPLALLVALGRPDLVSFAVFGALGSVYGKDAEPMARLLQQSVTGVLMVLAVGVGVLAGAPGAPTIVAVAASGAVSLVGLLLTRCTGWMPVPSLFLVFATGTIVSLHLPSTRLPLALAVATGSALFALVVGALVGWSQRGGRDLSSAFVGNGRASLGTLPTVVIAALHALVPPLAALAALALGWGHPFWAAVAATVPLAGATAVHRGVRTAQRALGTLTGVLLAAVVLAAHLPAGALVVVVAVCQVITELFVRRNYAIAVTAITPMALVLSDLGGAADPRELVLDRLLCTMLGLGIAIVLGEAVARWAPRAASRPGAGMSSAGRASRKVVPAWTEALQGGGSTPEPDSLTGRTGRPGSGVKESGSSVD